MSYDNALFPYHVILPEQVWQEKQAEHNSLDHALAQAHDRISILVRVIEDAEKVCDEWEVKNGDAPHRAVRLADRIRVNAGLPPSNTSSEGTT